MGRSTVEFHFHAEEEPAPFARLWKRAVGTLRRIVSGTEKFPELRRSYKITLDSNSNRNYGRPRWGADEGTKQLERSLARMLEAAMSRDEVSRMADDLHGFLFAGGQLDVVFDRALRGPTEDPLQAEIQIFAEDQASRALLTNLPWEIARDTIPAEQLNERLLLGTLASRPIVRAIPYPTSPVVRAARLRVLCCIANYKGDVLQFDAKAFEEAISESLSAQPIELVFVESPAHQPTAVQTFAEISRVDPHIFIFVGHGKSHFGKPQLRFEEWINVEEFAKHLAQTGQLLLAVFIACDQSRLIETPAAQSGALTLLNQGVPSVIAMQGYVNPKRAKAFLETFIKSLFVTHSISRAAALGRAAMDRPLEGADWSSDWVLPAVFRRVGEDFEQDQLSLVLGHYQPALERLLSFLPQHVFHLARPKLEEHLQDLISNTSGLVHLSGGIGTGKSHLVRVVVRTCIREAVDKRSTLGRPIFYVDLDECDEGLTSETWFISKLGSRLSEVRSLLATSTLTTMASSQLSSVELVGFLLNQLEKSQVVIIVDNLRADTTGFWAELMRRSLDLQKSLVLLAGPPDDLVPEGAKEFRVLPFDLEETKTYVRKFVTDDLSLAIRWHEDSGGTPLLLDGLRAFNTGSTLRAPRDLILRREGSIAAQYIELIKEATTAEEFAALAAFSLFPGLVEASLAYRFIPGDEPFTTLNKLVEIGVLSKFEKAGKEWLSMARLKADGLAEESVIEAASDLTIRFADEIFLADGSQKKLDAVAIHPGGINLLRGVQQAYLALADHKMALLLAGLLTSGLRDQPFELYKFFVSVLEPKPTVAVRDSDWVQAAGLARRVGQLDQADAFLAEVDDKKLTQFLRASMRNIKAIVMKDRGQSDKTEEILQLCGQALAIAQAGVNGDVGTEEATREEWLHLRANILFNRSAVLQFFARRQSEALHDVRQVQELEQNGDQAILAAAMSQEVDIRLSQPELIDGWDDLLELVRRAYVISSKGPVTHGFAYCCYQFARYYRKRPAQTTNDHLRDLRVAAKYYEEAARAASDVGDFKRHAVAVEHWVRVSWAELGTLNGLEAAAYLDELLDSLAEYRGDAFAARILRDMLLLRARIERAANGPRTREILKAASDAALAEQLSPDRNGEDHRRAVRIFVRYLEILHAENDVSMAEAFLVDNREILDMWVKEVRVDQPWETLIRLKEKEQLWAT